MRIFVTGATGFIGRHLVARLLQEDAELVCLVRPDERVRALRDSGLRATILYPASVLGAGDDKASGRYLRAVARPPWFRGGRGIPMLPFRQRRMTWVHVDDVVDAIWGALVSPRAVGNEYLVGGRVHTFEELHNMVAAALWGKPRHHKWYFPFNRLLLAPAAVLEPLGRWLEIEPPWGLTRDQIRTIVHGIRFRGDRARTDLLYGRAYRPIDRAVAEFFSDEWGADR